jgi:hypothetical protein
MTAELSGDKTFTESLAKIDDQLALGRLATYLNNYSESPRHNPLVLARKMRTLVRGILNGTIEMHLRVRSENPGTNFYTPAPLGERTDPEVWEPFEKKK